MFKVNTKAEVEKKNDLIKRAEELVNGAEAEQRELTDAEAQELAEIRDDVKAIKAKLDAVAELKDATEEVAEEVKENATDVEKAEQRAFENYVRGIITRDGDVVLDEANNGAVIPTSIANKIITRVYDICPILEKSTKYNVKGKLVIPYYDEGTTAITVDYADEFEELTSSVGNFDKIELDGFLAGALTLISRSLINKAQFNITDFIVNQMAIAIKRFIEKECLKGTASKIDGLSTLTNAVTTASTSAITADEVIKVHDAVKDDFQSGAMWFMSSATRTALRTLKSNDGHYLLNDDVSSPFGTTLLGKPVYVTDNMDDIGAGKTVIYYGDMSGLATKFSENISIEVLREKYATQHAVGVVGWTEFDAKVENAQKIAKLVMKAS